MSTTIEELQKIVADESRSTEERKQAAELILAMQGQTNDVADIADDNPELQKYLTDSDSETAKLFPQFCSFTIADAKKAMARDRHQKRLLEVAGDERLPLPQRTEAAVAWRSLRPAGNRWATLSDQDLVESLCPHPHLPRLEELSALVCNHALPKGDWRAYLQDQWAAIAEFKALRDKHPLRDAPVMLALESVASGFIKNASRELRDNFDWRREIFDYVKILDI